MADRAERQRARFALVKRIRYRRPVDRPRLCFHHPEALAFPAAHQLVAGAVAVRLDMALADIVVPGDEIEFAADLGSVEAVGPPQSAEIRGDELTWRDGLTQRFDLIPLEAEPRIGNVAFGVQHPARIAALCVERDLRPGRVCLAPVRCRPGTVEFLQRHVLVAQPFLKPFARRSFVRFLGVLVTDLPADHAGIVAESARKLRCDAAAEAAIAGAGNGEMSPAAVLGVAPVREHTADIGIGRRHPRRRRVGRCAQDRLEIPRFRFPDGASDPVQLEPSLARFHRAPGELADTHDVEAGLGHEIEIAAPCRFRPLLGIPRRAEPEPIELLLMPGAGRR